LQVIFAGNPFPLDLPDFGKKVYVAFFENAPSPAAIESVAGHVSAQEQLIVQGAEAYLYYDLGLGKAKLTHALIERRLGMSTMRNWNTVTTLLQMAE
jgi:uncharacterized protein (DUF1697 family)